MVSLKPSQLREWRMVLIDAIDNERLSPEMLASLRKMNLEMEIAIGMRHSEREAKAPTGRLRRAVPA